MKNLHLIRTLLTTMTLAAALATVAVASAHPHQVTTGNGGEVVIGNGQNHPGFVFNPETGLYESCEGVNDPANIGPAGYGLETAHHGPDQGTSGRADGCFALDGPATHPDQDNNPAID
jgi:hypothetical protein